MRSVPAGCAPAFVPRTAVSRRPTFSPPAGRRATCRTGAGSCRICSVTVWGGGGGGGVAAGRSFPRPRLRGRGQHGIEENAQSRARWGAFPRAQTRGNLGPLIPTFLPASWEKEWLPCRRLLSRGRASRLQRDHDSMVWFAVSLTGRKGSSRAAKNKFGSMPSPGWRNICLPPTLERHSAVAMQPVPTLSFRSAPAWVLS